MSLAYIWIEKYKCINQQGFNLNQDYFFEITLIENEMLYKLDVSKNQFNLDNFYSHKEVSISNLTAIVGQNGAGKSSFLEFLCKILPDGNGIDDFTKYIAIVKLGDISYKIIKVNINAEISISLPDNRLEIVEEEILNYNSSESLAHPFSDFYSVFYSNCFDSFYSNNKPHLTQGIIDISLNHLIRSLRLVKAENEKKDISQLREIDEFEKFELLNHLIFINDFKDLFTSQFNKLQKKKNEDLIPFELPKELYISDSHDFNNLQTIVLKDIKDDRVKDFIDKYFTLIITKTESVVTEKDNLQTKADFIIYKMLFFQIYCSIIYVHPKDYNYKKIINGKSKTLYDTIIFFSEVFFYVKENILALIEMHKIILNLMKNNKLIIENRYGFSRYDSHCYRLELCSADQFLNQYFKTQIVVQFFNFNWQGLSSGQLSLLSLYSRSYYAFNTLIKMSSKVDSLDRSNIILLLDEPEISWHPDWQREFIFRLLQLLYIETQKLNLYNISFQIIFTTNNPFTMSDLLSFNVLRLKRNNNATKTTVLNDFTKKSFAKNIYDLMKDDFFFENEFIGRFASISIKELHKDIENLHPDTISEEEINRIQKFIHSIGDTFICNFLENLFNVKSSIIESNISSIKKDNHTLQEKDS